MAAWGLSDDDLVTELWPDTLPSVNAFIAVGTQWRTGMSGATGLDYTGVEAALRMQAIPRKQWPRIFEDLRVLEAEALRVMRKD